MTSAGVTTQPLRWWHLRQVLELEEELFAPECWSEALFWSELAQGTRRRYTAAFDGAELVGYAGLAVGGEQAYVQTLGVTRRAQRGGLGAHLLERMLDQAAEAGARSVGLEVRADNDAAQRLYARHDFAVLGRRRGYYQPSGVDALIMVRELGSEQ